MIRGVGLRGAIAVNVITMIGIGPLITIPLVLATLPGSLALAAWIVGALIAICDGLVWAELGSRYPGSGGTYVFLREAFGPERLGRMLAFLFAWQTVLATPLLLASGYIGFAHYAAYLWPQLAAPMLQGIVAAAVAIVTVVLLYRPIGSIARISVLFGIVAIATLLVVILASAGHFSPAQALAYDRQTPVTSALFAGLGPALVITLYDYYGYGQVCFVGDEVREPRRILPLAIIWSLAIVGGLYVLLQIGVLGAVPWTSLVALSPGGTSPPAADYVASNVVELSWGVWAARLATLAILVTAFASTFGNLLGFSRIPFAAARDGVFLRPFGLLHERDHFPHVSLVVIGLLAVPFCFLTLGQVIAWLIAALVLIQNLGQIAALIALRLRGERAPYRMWLFPLPLIAATAAWIWIFWSSGFLAIGYGLLTLLVGTIVYLVFAKIKTQWPFGSKTAVALAALFTLSCGILATPSQAAQPEPSSRISMPTFTHAAIVERDGFPVFEVDGKPFFVYGAAFFYERLPRSDWARSMRALRSLGINTLDLYVIWNWHEPSDGAFDFDGRTSPRRDLRTLLKLARENGFKLIVRPGPVIRNEWRNGGYPAWLLARPEYGMPLHDLLEGRYPPTATLQNAHSDDAAAEWMRNATHMRYATRWIHRVLEEFRPYADLVLAVQLDDDQGAYLDNQTWPAPHLTAYLNYLKSVVHSVTGPREPVFINTYQMKVTASSPVWAMGNWYQSDAYSIGEHDRVQLEFSTGLLQTRPHQPLMYSEFQAGWLLGPDDIRPRPADPSNTLLAMTTLLGMGVRGIVNFPAQDTLYPTGWEAPFANWFYAWDAALGFGSSPPPWQYQPSDTFQDRWFRTSAVGSFVQRFGSRLAAARPLWDAGILYSVSAYDSRTMRAASIAGIADATQQAQRSCRELSLACRLIDLRYVPAEELAKLPILFIPISKTAGNQMIGSIRRRLARYSAGGGIVFQLDRRLRDIDVAWLLGQAHHVRIVSGAAGATYAQSSDRNIRGFLTIPNYATKEAHLAGVVIQPPGESPIHFRQIDIAPRDAFLTAIPEDVERISVTKRRTRPWRGAAIPIRRDVALESPAWSECATHSGAICVSNVDVFDEGQSSMALQNAVLRLIISQHAGARSFVFEDRARQSNIFTSVGALRDDVKIEPPPSKTDRIAKYTHQFPAGMFNRPYRAETLESKKRAVVRFSYDAPDVVPAGTHFERTIRLEPDSRSFTMDERVTFNGDAAGIGQRAVSVNSLAVGDSSRMTTQIVLTPNPSLFAVDKRLTVTGNALGFYDTKSHELATIAWRPGDVEDAKVLERHYSIVARFTLTPGRTARIAYGYYFADSLEQASLRLRKAASNVELAKR